jgi:2-polyprenyl-3-methyl-5-hydroxy-6-metoxy-1,4-benzoquinol methylase
VKDPSAIYDAAWFVKDFDHHGVRDDFRLIADAIYRQFRPSMVFDYGCGPGMILERLDEVGVGIQGYEGSIHGINHAAMHIRSRIHHADLTTMNPLGLPRIEGELVICTEVAEHLEEQHAAHLVKLLCGHMAPIIFTAAPPGQGGHDHVNEKPKEWWLNLFAQHGALMSVASTDETVKRWASVKVLHHMPRNVMVIW